MSSSTEGDEPPTEAAGICDVLQAETAVSDLLLLGPTLSDKDLLAFDLLIDAWEDTGAPIIISATDTAAEFRSRFDPRLPADLTADDAYVIDCTESELSTETAANRTCSAASPADLTGVSICLSKGFERIGPGQPSRLLVDNISTLLIYSEFERVYQFISTINQRANEADVGTVYLVDTDAIESADRNKLFQLFKTIVEVRQEGQAPQFRVRGRSESPWYEYLPKGGDH